MTTLNKAVYQSIEAPIGFVKKSYGQVFAYDPADQRRSLKVGDEVYAFDTIQTRSGFIMVEFIDGSWMDMGAYDQITFNESLFGKETLTALTSTKPDDINLIKEALLAGKDPTDIAQPTAAGPENEGAIEDLGSTPPVVERENSGVQLVEDFISTTLVTVQPSVNLRQTISEIEVDEADKTISINPVTILGTAADDILFGTPGNDLITGGPGNDTTTGNAGADGFIWNQDDDGTVADPANDVITDFSRAEGDFLNFSDLLVGEDASNLDLFLDASFLGGNTLIDVNPVPLGGVTQQVVLNGVDLSVDFGTADSATIINNLLNEGSIIIT